MSPLRLAPTGPGPEAARVIAEVKAWLRRRDVRAIAVVMVTPHGDVSTVIGGSSEGHYHTLNSGIAILSQRHLEDRER